jgi:acetyl esterase/lipase
MIKKLFSLLLAMFVIASIVKGQYCTKDARYTEKKYFDSTQISIGSNVQYGTAADYQGNPYTMRMDLYYPNLNIDTAAKRPFVLLIHGGGFSSGDKQSGDIKDLCIHMAMRGFVCASLNYRLGHDFSEYGQYKARYRSIQDGHAALRYIVNNANTVRIDTNWLFVGGQSAGALTALGLVYAEQNELDSIALLYNATSTSDELGNLFTSGNNLTNRYAIKGVFNNWGGIVKSEVDIDEMIPTVAFHGGEDTLVEIDADNSFANYTLKGSRALHNDLTANDICSELTVDTAGEHGIFRNASSLFRAQRASCFFKSVFCKKCTSFYTKDSIPSNCSSPLSIKEQDLNPNIKIYPNPFENYFKIDGVDGVLDISIYNYFGQVVYHNETSLGMVEIDLKPGIYFVKIKQIETNRLFTVKLIKS